jgi:hypothetical protein
MSHQNPENVASADAGAVMLNVSVPLKVTVEVNVNVGVVELAAKLIVPIETPFLSRVTTILPVGATLQPAFVPVNPLGIVTTRGGVE